MYLDRIYRALENVNYPYAVNNVRLVCRDIIQNEKLTGVEKDTMKIFMEEIAKTEYLNIFNYQIDKEKLENFREVSLELWMYIDDVLGFK